MRSSVGDQRGLRESYGITDVMRDDAGTTVHVIGLKKVVETLIG